MGSRNIWQDSGSGGKGLVCGRLSSADHGFYGTSWLDSEFGGWDRSWSMWLIDQVIRCLKLGIWWRWSLLVLSPLEVLQVGLDFGSG